MKASIKFLTGILFFLSFVIVLSACQKKDDASSEGVQDSQSNTSESAAAAANSIANDTEGGSVGFSSVEPGQVHEQSACNLASARSACSGATSSVTFNSCTILLGLVTLNGGWKNTYDSGSTCTTAQGASGLLPSGGSVTRTSSSLVVSLANGASLTTDTTTHSAYDGTSIPGNGVSTSRSGGTRTVVINGFHRVLKGPKGTKWFDHSLTSSGVTITGTKAGANRVVTGSLVLYHNLARYTATATFNNVTWGSASCCYPTSGNVSTTFSGALTGTATLTYGSCGSATFVDTTGASSTVTLSQCE